MAKYYFHYRKPHYISNRTIIVDDEGYGAPYAWYMARDFLVHKGMKLAHILSSEKEGRFTCVSVHFQGPPLKEKRW